MVLNFVFRALFIAFLLFGCTQVERDNPYDPDGINYKPGLVEISSSSVETCTANSNTSTHYCSEGVMKEYGLLTDNRSNPPQTYKTVVIGTQTWMAENLNYAASGSKCYGDNSGGDSQGNCVKYGRLYNWSTAMNNSASSNNVPSGVRGICPDGWHLPSDAEWDALMTAVGGSSTAGTKLRSATGWNTKSGYIPGTDDYGFSALPGGYGGSDGNFYNVGINDYWWSATEDNSYYAWSRDMYYDISDVYRSYSNMSRLFSVRCLQDLAVGVLAPYQTPIFSQRFGRVKQEPGKRSWKMKNI